ncbi:MAG: MBOAT family O-acyltransferase [Myxococcota bacterium]|nr:MBOAT family O-acyltransferase [Myxococcota bacterium]
MLFNSNAFLFLFLPIVLLVFFAMASRRGSLALGWLVVASLFFYGWWNPAYLGLLFTSIVVGFVLAQAAGRSRGWLPVGLVFHLGLIGWFKYAGFLSGELEQLSGWPVALAPVGLPLAISFFTFQQIAFLVDCSRGRARETRFLHYVLFVTFFPQLISGPIVHHREMIPQFERTLRFEWSHFAVGLTFLAVGLFKKTVLADGMAVHTTPIYEAAARGVPIGLWAGWTAALGYTLQLYFDFSGYSDMAVGLARMFGIRLPLNFHSPLKSESIIEFWRRWHMTLSRFLRDYLYIPLGGSRRGSLRRWSNLLVTMLLGGLWHGASWTFVFWGGLHGVYLVINHAFRVLKRRVGISRVLPPALGRPIAVLTTFLAVVVAFVTFRAADLLVSLSILTGMAGFRGSAGRPVEVEAGFWIAGLLVIAWGLPNTQQLLRDHDPGIDIYDHLREKPWFGIAWQPRPGWALFTLTLLAAALFGIMVEGHVEFLYRFF